MTYNWTIVNKYIFSAKHNFESSITYLTFQLPDKLTIIQRLSKQSEVSILIL